MLNELCTVSFVNKLTVKVGAKKIKYQQLIDKKTVLVSHRENVQERKLESELRIVSVSEEIKGKRKFIETWEEGMKRLKQAINQEMKEIDELNDCVSEETKKVDSSSKTIQKFDSKLKQVEDDIIATCQMNDKTDLVEANNKLQTANAELKNS